YVLRDFFFPDLHFGHILYIHQHPPYPMLFNRGIKHYLTPKIFLIYIKITVCYPKDRRPGGGVLTPAPYQSFTSIQYSLIIQSALIVRYSPSCSSSGSSPKMIPFDVI